MRSVAAQKGRRAATKNKKNMNLLIDIGNTAAKIAVSENNEIVFRETVSQVTNEILDRLLSDNPLIDKAIVASTGRDGDRVFGMVSGRVGYALRLEATTPVPIANGYGSPETLGVDRLAAAVGAQSLYGRRNMLIVDFGTAVTVDLVTDGVFRGGNISLGVGARFRALHEYTSSLPLCGPTDEEQEFGTTTRTAVEQGVMTGLAYEIEGYIADFGARYENLCTIFTGGDAIFFVKRIKNTIFANRDLTLVGLNGILEYNAKIRNHK